MNSIKEENNKTQETLIKISFIWKITPQKAIILAVSLWIMTKQETQSALADWEKIDKLEKEWKLEESKKLKAEAISKITRLYIDQFPKEELWIKSVEKIWAIDKQLQEILFKCFDLWIEKITDEKVRKQFTIRITTFFQWVNKNSGWLVEYAQKNLETLPWFAWSSLYNTLYAFAKESDDYITWEINKEIKKWAERDKRINIRNKLLWQLNQIK